ncbi:MAG: acyl-CoA thioesterase [Proteobacteria bacterium]|nr:acyl-CoA thioesterase [Pseudomonadota bacterium]
MRSPPIPLSAYPWQTEHEIRFADVDQLGHVNNGAYGSFMESSRSALMREWGLPPAISIVIVRFEIDYLKEMNWPGHIIAPSGLEQVGRSSLRLRQAVFMDGTCRAEAIAILALFNLATRRAEPIPDDLRDGLARWHLLG